MTCINFQGLPSRVVPKLQSVIQSGNENVLAVGRELGEGNGRTIVLNERLQESAGVGGPDLAGAVVTAGDNERSVTVEIDGGDRHGMGGNSVEGAAGLNIPDPNGLVEGAGDNEVGLGVEIDAEDQVGVAAEGLHAFSGLGIPDAESEVVGGGADVVGVGGPCQVGDAVGVANKAGLEG